MARGGKREGAGRPPGPDKSKRMLAEILEAIGCNPLENLAKIAKGERVHCATGINKELGEFMEEDALPTMDQIITANKELLQYVHPKKKAIEHTGKDGGEIPLGLALRFVKTD